MQQIIVGNDGTKVYKNVVKVAEGEDPFAKYTRGTRAGKDAEFPFLGMTVGQFFFVKDEPTARKAYQALNKNKAFEEMRKTLNAETFSIKPFPKLVEKYKSENFEVDETSYVVRLITREVKSETTPK